MVDPFTQGISLAATILSLGGLAVVSVMKRRSGCRCELPEDHRVNKCSGRFMGTWRFCLLLIFTACMLGFLVSIGTF